MKILALDVSTKTGYCLLDSTSGQLLSHGLVTIDIDDFNVNAKPGPNHSPKYPWNLLQASDEMGKKIHELILYHKPDVIVMENTVKGRNRHTQRILEWIHKSALHLIQQTALEFHYLDPSEWRTILEIRMTNQDKKNNRLVAQGKKRGKITRKHMSVRWVNEHFNLNFKLKDNDICDAIALGYAYFVRTR